MACLGKTRHSDYFYNANQETVELAKFLRKTMTPSEKLLWERLRRKNILDVKFRRQHPIGFYIVDFYCHELSLVIEVDGLVHNSLESKNHDRNRSAEMDRFGIKVIRFTNNEIKNNISSVIQRIRNEVSQRFDQQISSQNL